MIIFFEISVVAVLFVAVIAASLTVITAEFIGSFFGIISVIVVIVYSVYTIALSISYIGTSKAAIPIALINAVRAYPTAIFLYGLGSALGSILTNFNIMAILGGVVLVPVFVIIIGFCEAVALQAYAYAGEEDGLSVFLGIIIIIADTAGFWIALNWFINTFAKK